MYLLSSDYEGIPNALLESLAIGIPCIATDCPCGGVHELIQNGENGYIISGSDDNTINLELTVAPEGMGKVIGKSGRIAKAIRTVVKAAASKGDKKVVVDIR